MDIEHGALCRIIIDQDIVPAVEGHITAKFFEDPNNLRIWELLLGHWQTYGTVADFSVVRSAYPTWTPYSYDEPLAFFLDQLRDRRKYRIALNAVTEGFALAEEGGPLVGDQFLNKIRQGISDAVTEVPAGKDVDYFNHFEAGTLARLKYRVAHPGLRGYQTGFPTLDHITGGFQNGQLITLVAVPKVGKSTLSLYSAYNARMSGIRVLYLTFEMSAEEQEDRLASFVSGVGLTNILEGSLTPADVEKVRHEHALWAESHSGLTIVADTSSVTTVSDVQAKVRHYRPQMVYIDGMYLMDDEHGEDKGSPQALTNITRGTKRMAQAENIPVFATTQGLIARARGGVNMSTAAYSSSFAQDSDLMLGADRFPHGISKISVLASRASRNGSFYVDIDWTKGSIVEIEEAAAEIIIATPEDAATTGRRRQSFLMED